MITDDLPTFKMGNLFRLGRSHGRREVTVSAQVYQQVSVQNQREALILGNLGLVRHILGRLAARFPRGVDVDNLEAAGVLGLVEAANRFEPERNISFKTFAFTRIRGAIYDELRRNCPLPQELLERTAKVRKILQAMPPPATIDKLALASGYTEDEVTECLAAMRMTRNVSWDNIAANYNGQTTEADDRPDRLMESAERKKLLVEAITQLPESERLVSYSVLHGRTAAQGNWPGAQPFGIARVAVIEIRRTPHRRTHPRQGR